MTSFARNWWYWFIITFVYNISDIFMDSKVRSVLNKKACMPMPCLCGIVIEKIMDGYSSSSSTTHTSVIFWGVLCEDSTTTPTAQPTESSHRGKNNCKTSWLLLRYLLLYKEPLKPLESKNQSIEGIIQNLTIVSPFLDFNLCMKWTCCKGSEVYEDETFF